MEIIREKLASTIIISSCVQPSSAVIRTTTDADSTPPMGPQDTRCNPVLPIDLLSLIFTEALRPITSAAQLTPPSLNHVPLNVAHVSRLWRTAAFDTPAIWSRIYFNDADDGFIRRDRSLAKKLDMAVAYWTACMARSGSHVLDIKLGIGRLKALWGVEGWGGRVVNDENLLSVHSLVATRISGGTGVEMFSKKAELCALVKDLFTSQRHRWRLADISMLDCAVPPGYLTRLDMQFYDVAYLGASSKTHMIRILDGLPRLEELRLDIVQSLTTPDTSEPTPSTAQAQDVQGLEQTHNSPQNDAYSIALRIPIPPNSVLVDTSSSLRLRLFVCGGSCLPASQVHSIRTSRVTLTSQSLAKTHYHASLTKHHINSSIIYLFQHHLFFLASTPALEEFNISCDGKFSTPSINALVRRISAVTAETSCALITLPNLKTMQIASQLQVDGYILALHLAALLLHIRTPVLQVLTLNLQWARWRSRSLSRVLDASRHMLTRSGVEETCEVRCVRRSTNAD